MKFFITSQKSPIVPPPHDAGSFIYTYVIDRLYTFVSSPLSPCCSYLRDTLRGSVRYFRRRLRLVARPGLRPSRRCSGSDVTVGTRYNGGTTRGAAQGSRLMPQDREIDNIELNRAPLSQIIYSSSSLELPFTLHAHACVQLPARGKA